MDKLADRLRELRKEFGLTQAGLAAQLNLTPGAIANYETSERLPAIDVLQKLSEFFGVSMDYLTGRSDFKRGVPDPLESDWPEGIRVLRRASKRMTPEEKQFITDMIQAYLERREQERKRGK